ncbi:MAG: RidA family protein [Clostridiales bacterium]|nr:RidA family protein [Clostridiales bacterium]
MKKISTEKAPAAVGPYSQAMEINGMVYTSGQIALDPATGGMVGTTIEEQAEQVMKNLTAVLEAAGTGPENAVKTLCFLTDMNDFAAFNAIYARYFTGNPARSCVEVRALPKGAVCEVEVIATLPHL